jgi:THO complex subunit 1
MSSLQIFIQNPSALTSYSLSLLQHILDREENWISWKNEGCPSFIKEKDK